MEDDLLKRLLSISLNELDLPASFFGDLFAGFRIGLRVSGVASCGLQSGGDSPGGWWSDPAGGVLLSPLLTTHQENPTAVFTAL